jgi:hypothetical protein
MRWWWTSLAIALACSGGGTQPARTPATAPDGNDVVETGDTSTTPSNPSDPEAPGTPMGPEYLSAGMLEGDVALDEAWTRWRAKSAATTFTALFEIAVLANRARPLETADELMVLALDQAVAASGCDPERLGKIRLLAIAVLGAEHPTALDGALIRLADLGPAECKLR